MGRQRKEKVKNSCFVYRVENLLSGQRGDCLRSTWYLKARDNEG